MNNQEEFLIMTKYNDNNHQPDETSTETYFTIIENLFFDEDYLVKEFIAPRLKVFLVEPRFRTEVEDFILMGLKIYFKKMFSQMTSDDVEETLTRELFYKHPELYETYFDMRSYYK